MMWKAFFSSWIIFSFLKYLYFCADVFDHAGNRLDKEVRVKINPKIDTYEVINWETYNNNTHIVQYLNK